MCVQAVPPVQCAPDMMMSFVLWVLCRKYVNEDTRTRWSKPPIEKRPSLATVEGEFYVSFNTILEVCYALGIYRKSKRVFYVLFCCAFGVL